MTCASPSNSGSTQCDGKAYAQTRRAAIAEGRAVLAWRDQILKQLLAWRAAHYQAYNRAKATILREGLDSARGSFAADVADVAEANYQRLDRQIEALEQASFSKLLQHFNTWKERAA